MCVYIYIVKYGEGDPKREKSENNFDSRKIIRKDFRSIK